MSSIYQEHILDHYSSPRNKGVIENPDIYYKDSNPLCGDEIAIYAVLEGNIISKICFIARGCAISQAAASMLTESVKGKPVSYAYGLASDDIVGMLSIPLSPARLKCAVLAMKTLQAGIVLYRGKKNGAS